MDMVNNIFKMVTLIKAIISIINSMAMAHILGKVEHHIQANSKMVKEMALVSGYQV